LTFGFSILNDKVSPSSSPKYTPKSFLLKGHDAGFWGEEVRGGGSLENETWLNKAEITKHAPYFKKSRRHDLRKAGQFG
jgi:hypothetical protein